MRRIFARGASVDSLPSGPNPVMKVAVGIVLIAISFAANAVQVLLLTHNQTSGGGAISTLITDGSQINGGVPASTAVWDWDGTTLTANGLYTATGSLASSPVSPAVLSDSVTDLLIDTGPGTATATAYACVEGTFLAGVGANGCGDYTLGVNFIDESTTVWGPGLAISQTIGGDDVAGVVGPRSVSAYDFGSVTITGTGLTPGDQVLIGNGIAVGVPSGELMTFEIQTSAVDDATSARPTTLTNIPVLANDALLDNITALVPTVPTNGTAVVNGTLPGPRAGLSIDYTSAAGFVGDATFDYTVTDANGAPVTATVTVTVTDEVIANDDGDAAAPFATVLVGETVSLDVLANDIGLNDVPLTVDAPVNAMPTLGMATVTGSPGDASAIRIDYTAGQTEGVDSFGYQVADNGGKMDTATVFIEVAIPSMLVAVDDAATTTVEAPVSINVLTNDTGLDDTPLTVAVTTDPANGSIGTITACNIQATCDVPYTPNAGFIGTDTFQYMITDNSGDDSNIATVTITVNEVPIAVADAATTSGTTPVTINVLANDSGLSFTPHTVTVTGTAATTGTTVVQADNTIVYTPPAAGTSTTDAFEYTVTDANGSSGAAFVTITIIPTQDSLPGTSSAVGPVSLGMLMLLSWMRRRRH